jgi:hypothetical protein
VTPIYTVRTAASHNARSAPSPRRLVRRRAPEIPDGARRPTLVSPHYYQPPYDLALYSQDPATGTAGVGQRSNTQEAVQ